VFNFEDTSCPSVAIRDITTSIIFEVLFENNLSFDLQLDSQNYYKLTSYIYYQDSRLTQSPIFFKFYSSLLSDSDKQLDAALYYRLATIKLNLDFC